MLCEMYWPNGQLKRRCHVEKGKRSGLDQMWSEEGVLVDEGHYEEGRAVGIHRRFREDGTLIEEIAYDGSSPSPPPKMKEISPPPFTPLAGDPATLFMERFPKLALLAPTWPVGPIHLEELEDPRPGAVDLIYVMGLGGGAPYRQLMSWLREDPTRKLVILEKEPSLIAAWLPFGADLLADPQVFLELLEGTDEASRLAQKYPYGRIQILAIPSQKTRAFSRFRLQLLRKTTLSYALHIERMHGYQPFSNFVKNLRQLPHSFYANKLRGAFPHIPVIICGAGPSLKEAIPLLQKLSKRALLIAGGSAITALSAHGLIPHFGMAIDPNLEEYRRLRSSYAFKMPLLYSTRVFPDIFRTLDGPFGYMRCGIGGVPEVWMEEELGLTDPFIGEKLSEESISVTTIATAFAQFIGAGPILFAGLDLAYTDNKRYAEGVIDANQILHSPGVADQLLVKKDKTGKKVHTAVRWVIEASGLSRFAKAHPEISFFNTTPGGLPLDSIPYLSLEEAEKRLFPEVYEDLPSRITTAIANASMPPDVRLMIQEQMEKLRASLTRVLDHLAILTDRQKGSKALAEFELEEELALSILFYDIGSLLSHFPPEEKWERFYHLALKYNEVLLGSFFLLKN